MSNQCKLVPRRKVFSLNSFEEKLKELSTELYYDSQSQGEDVSSTDANPPDKAIEKHGFDLEPDVIDPPHITHVQNRKQKTAQQTKAQAQVYEDRQLVRRTMWQYVYGQDQFRESAMSKLSIIQDHFQKYCSDLTIKQQVEQRIRKIRQCANLKEINELTRQLLRYHRRFFNQYVFPQ